MLSFAHHMALQDLPAVGSEGTLVTAVSGLFLVLVDHCPLVSMKCPTVIETCSTVITLEWFQVCVNDGVQAQIFSRTELFVALGTFFVSHVDIGRIVNFLMLFQI